MAPNRQRFADARYKPLIRCGGMLAVGTTFSMGGVLYEIHNVGGCARVRVRLSCPTGGGNLDLFFVGPDVDIDAVIANADAYAAIPGTIYATGGPGTVAVVAGVEGVIQSDCYGEGYVIMRFTANVGGTIGYCDICRV